MIEQREVAGPLRARTQPADLRPVRANKDERGGAHLIGRRLGDHGRREQQALNEERADDGQKNHAEQRTCTS